MTKQALVQELLQKNNLDAVLFYSPENRFWYTDFISTLGYLIITKEKADLFVDGRYITEAKEFAKNVTPIGFNSVYNTLNEKFTKEKLTTIGFESNWITVDQLSDWQKALPNIKFVPIKTQTLRMIKDETEVARIQEACRIGDIAFQDVLKAVKPGMKETDVESIILNSFAKNGATKASFDTIVASGLRSAMPHGKASDKVINNNEIITCDFGCIYEGFCSDMTRTFVIGKIDEKLMKIHEIVKTAQMKGIEAVKPGIAIGEIDKICRDYISGQGYGEYFTHGTGHGLGIEIHEAPWVIKNEPTILAPGMVITVEPGIYVPGLGGTRIEDDILVTENGYQILTKANRSIDALMEQK